MWTWLGLMRVFSNFQEARPVLETRPPFNARPAIPPETSLGKATAVTVHIIELLRHRRTVANPDSTRTYTSQTHSPL